MVRSGVELTSDKAGKIEAGVVVRVVEEARSSQGTLRARVAWDEEEGWVSFKTLRRGTPAEVAAELARLAGPPAPAPVAESGGAATATTAATAATAATADAAADADDETVVPIVEFVDREERDAALHRGGRAAANALEASLAANGQSSYYYAHGTARTAESRPPPRIEAAAPSRVDEASALQANRRDKGPSSYYYAHEVEQTHRIDDVAPRRVEADAGDRPAARATAKVAVENYAFTDQGDQIVVTLPVPANLGDDRISVSHDEASLRVEIDGGTATRVLQLPTTNGPFFRGITKVATRRTGGTLRLAVHQLVHDIQVVRQ